MPRRLNVIMIHPNIYTYILSGQRLARLAKRSAIIDARVPLSSAGQKAVGEKMTKRKESPNADSTARFCKATPSKPFEVSPPTWLTPVGRRQSIELLETNH